MLTQVAPQLADDLLQPFQVDGLGVRGRLVRLGAAVDEVLERHHYPAPVSVMLGELLTLASVLAGALKFDGVLSLQTKSDGPVSMMVADFEVPGSLRGYARFDPDAIGEVSGVVGRAPSVAAVLGAGHLAITVDQGPDTETYQGIVALEGTTLAGCANTYFSQSEQLNTGIHLAVGRVAAEGAGETWRTGGIMIQRMPPAGGADASDLPEDDDWHAALALLGTVRPDELVDPGITPDRLLYRLFQRHGPRVFRALPLKAGCRCSQGRMREVLSMFPRREVEAMVEEGRIVVTCQFCNRTYVFAPEEVAAAAQPGKEAT